MNMNDVVASGKRSVEDRAQLELAAPDIIQWSDKATKVRRIFLINGDHLPLVRGFLAASAEVQGHYCSHCPHTSYFPQDGNIISETTVECTSCLKQTLVLSLHRIHTHCSPHDVNKSER